MTLKQIQEEAKKEFMEWACQKDGDKWGDWLEWKETPIPDTIILWLSKTLEESIKKAFKEVVPKESSSQLFVEGKPLTPPVFLEKDKGFNQALNELQTNIDNFMGVDRCVSSSGCTICRNNPCRCEITII